MFAPTFLNNEVMMVMLLLAAGLCNFEVATAAEAGLGLGDIKAVAEATVQGTLERKAAMAKEIIDKTLHSGKATSTLNAATATPTPTIPNTGTVLVVVNFVTRITTFSVANFTTIPQQQYVDAIYQSITPNVFQVLINSIIQGSVIVNTTAVIPQNQVSNFRSAADNSFGLPPATFGQPEVSPFSVSLAPGNTTLPLSTLPIASATPPPPTTPGAQSTGAPPITVQPHTTTAGGTTAQPLQTTAAEGTTTQPPSTIEASTAPPDTSTAVPTTNPPTTPPPTTPPGTSAIVPTSTMLMTSPPPTTPSDKCLRLPSPTACNANMCATPPNTYEFCGCGELDQSVDIEMVGGLTNLTYYTCLRNITGSLSLMNDPDLATLNGLEDLTNIDGAFEISATPVLTNIGSSLPALQTVGDVSISSNDGLTTINGFNALQTANNIFISGNNNLATINGLNALNSSGNIYVGGNPSLTSVQGFEALATVNGLLQFTLNDGITTFDGSSFAALERVVGQFDISTDNYGAAALTSISGFTALTTVDGPFTIQNNLQLQSITGFQALANITTSDVLSRYVNIDSAATLTQASLVDISGLATLAQCGIPDGDFQYSSGDPYLNSISLKIDVFPPGVRPRAL
ncbi:g8745 [Coccomyxa elongata]